MGFTRGEKIGGAALVVGVILIILGIILLTQDVAMGWIPLPIGAVIGLLGALVYIEVIPLP
jgi:hypothetical protein